MYLLIYLYYIFTLVILLYLLHICVLLLFILWRLNKIQSINQSIKITYVSLGIFFIKLFFNALQVSTKQTYNQILDQRRAMQPNRMESAHVEKWTQSTIKC